MHRVTWENGPTPRWSLVAAAFAVGLVGGLLLAARLFGSTPNLEEQYFVLLSRLYAQGEPVERLRERLVGLGYSQPGPAVLALAERYAADPARQSAADLLRRFAEALQAAPTAGGGGAPTPTTTPAPTVTTTPLAGAVRGPTATPVAARPTPAPTPTAAPLSRARVQGEGGVRLRQAPTTEAPAVLLLPAGETVEVLEVVSGQAVVPGEARWYRVRARDRVGYIYATFLTAGE